MQKFRFLSLLLIICFSASLEGYGLAASHTINKKVSIHNNSSKSKELFIISDQFVLENVVFKYRDDSTWKSATSGWGRPLKERMIPSYLHVFYLTVPAKSSKTVYFEVENKYQINKLPLKIMSKEQFFTYNSLLLILDGLVIMALLMSVFFSIFNLISTPDYRKILWLYLIYAFNFLVFYCFRVVSPIFISEPIPVVYNYYINVAIFISTYTFLRFAVAFVNTGEIKEDKKVVIIIDSLFVLAVVFSLFPSQVNNPIFFGMKLIFFLSTILYHSVYMIASYKKNELARIYIVMALPLILSGLAEGLTNVFGVIDLPSSLFEAFRVSIVIEMLFILFALIYRERFINKKIKKKLFDTELQLATAQIDIQEREQKRISQDLHDDLGGTLASFKRFVFDKLNPPEKDEDLEKLNYLAKKASDDLRRISHSLMPPDFERQGLLDSIRDLIRMNSGFGRTIAFQEHGERKELDSVKALHVYRILSEIIQNLNKHSKATNVLVQMLWSKDEFTLMVEDDGSVFGSNEEGLGMKNMRMRAAYMNGTINFDHNQKGSTIILEIPLK